MEVTSPRAEYANSGRRGSEWRTPAVEVGKAGALWEESAASTLKGQIQKAGRGEQGRTSGKPPFANSMEILWNFPESDKRANGREIVAHQFRLDMMYSQQGTEFSGIHRNMDLVVPLASFPDEAGVVSGVPHGSKIGGLRAGYRGRGCRRGGGRDSRNKCGVEAPGDTRGGKSATADKKMLGSLWQGDVQVTRVLGTSGWVIGRVARSLCWAWQVGGKHKGQRCGGVDSRSSDRSDRFSTTNPVFAQRRRKIMKDVLVDAAEDNIPDDEGVEIDSDEEYRA
ncbi:hypothetical protein B0H16DRAFT_1701609 [Mycena metata]|uniref:Uncharacterized protein n=1 Tax=Mycena metata TaxID=1033252 RepID=A0AAD7HAY0_9AGAR|nr:hypothetical protein B0H16DRAFT_1701609 [Mycena metata]